MLVFTVVTQAQPVSGFSGRTNTIYLKVLVLVNISPSKGESAGIAGKKKDNRQRLGRSKAGSLVLPLQGIYGCIFSRCDVQEHV